MRSLLLLLALASVSLASSASAQVRFLPYIGYNTSAGIDIEQSIENEGELTQSGAFLVGVGAEFGLTPGILPVALKVRPSVETAFLSGEDDLLGLGIEATQRLLQANLDVVADFSPPLAPVGVFAGAGLAFASYGFEISGGGESEEADDTAFGLNLLAGGRFGGGFIQPFVQARYTMITLRPGENDLPEGEEFDPDDELNGGLSIMAGVSIGL